ncbi:fibronectin type III domain-containing protein [Catenulispora acidiphila DSM 44928]|uniref:Fibronectin type III domain-containing protein n=1 Tax=Catenulispora acidiphila (strain DSM 44928 / JCM 14897 / NBRC 102108 / NRRL B-24433 / ID139908) TaxID=479433 RepID=C7QAL6_CATAD|nr:cell wall-binding repeat-containing protein [Catenulispora acidiphila]ACU72515.1 fibronectin type III domain-containing protein [Catenulispora acidiphila DSM 44928]
MSSTTPYDRPPHESARLTAAAHKNSARRRITSAAIISILIAATTTAIATTPAHATARGGNGFIAFQAPVGNAFGIALARPDGSGFHVLDVRGAGMADPPVLVNPAMSPDGTRIAFAEGGGSKAVWTVGVDGSHPVRVSTPPPSAGDTFPAWSPDGVRVFFTRADGVTPSQILSAFADGSGGTTPLFEAPTGFSDSNPDVGPDGSVAFTRSGGPNPGVYLRTPHGATALFAAGGANPSFNPLGTLIAYDSPVPFAGRAIFTKPTNGGIETLVQGTGFGTMPSWSPDGFKITYRDQTPNAGVHLKVVDVNSDTITSVTTGAQIGTIESDPSWQPVRNVAIDRMGGADRIDTAIDASRLGYDDAGPGGRQAGGAVITRSDSFADALADSALAAKLHAPLLLTGTHSLDGRVAAELKRILKPGAQVTLLGGTDVMSQKVADQVAALNFSTRRLQGPDRYATATAIANAITPNPARILVATGNNFPDALAAGAAAGAGDATGENTVVLLSNDGTLPSSTSAYLGAHSPANVELFGIGDQGVAALRTMFPVGKVGAAAGADRFGTAAAVARTFFSGPTTPRSVGVAVASNWPDALSGGALLGAHTAPLLLAAGPQLPAVEGDYVSNTSASVDEVLVFGDTGVVPNGAAAAVGDRAGLPGLQDYFVNRKAPALP